MPRMTTPVIEAMRLIGTMRMTAERQRQALELRGEHEEDEHDAEREGKRRGVAGADLLVGEFGPFVAEALRQRFGRQLLHQVDRLTLRVARRGGAVELGRRIEIVARARARGPRCRARS